MQTPAQIILAKTPLPTHLDSAEIRDQWSAEIRERAFFSAKTAQMGYLKRAQKVVAAVASGQMNDATARMHLLAQLDAIGYDPGDTDKGIQDLSGKRRLNLILDTQREMASSAAMLAAQTPASIELYPAWRLERYEGRAVPRTDWGGRWSAAGNAVSWEGAVQGAMVALKSSPIWAALGEGAGGYDDAIGNPYPPFAFNSGLNWTPVSAATCKMLGLDTTDASAPPASLRPGEREIADTLKRYGSDWTAALLKDLEAPSA